MTRTKARSCDGKVAYTRKEAKSRASYLRRARFARVHHYNCDFCPHWHVGHKPLPKRHKRRVAS